MKNKTDLALVEYLVKYKYQDTVQMNGIPACTVHLST